MFNKSTTGLCIEGRDMDWRHADNAIFLEELAGPSRESRSMTLYKVSGGSQNC